MVFGQQDHETQCYTLEDAAEAGFLDESTHRDGWRQAVRTRPLYSMKLVRPLFLFLVGIGPASGCFIYGGSIGVKWIGISNAGYPVTKSCTLGPPRVST